MKHLLRRRDTEADIDRIVDGDPMSDDVAGLGEVEAFLSEMRSEFAEIPAPEPRPTLASTLDGRRPLRPASSGPRTKPTIPEPRPRRRLLRPAAVVFAAGAAVFGGLAGAGALPGPVQRGTAELSSHLGIDLPGAPEPVPSPGDRVDPGTDVPRTGSSKTTPEAGTSPTTAPSVVPTPPSTVPAVPILPAPPALPTPTTLPLPQVGTFLEPAPLLPGLPEPVRRPGVWPTDLIP
jgi:hypothetical protein